MLRGEKRGFFGLTGPSGGSDPARAIRTRAVKDGSDWIINGSKVFISGADKADFGLVFARTDAEKGRGGITCFIVDTDMKGFHVRRVVHTLRSSHYATELQFEDLRVPHANILGEVNKGFAIANDRLSRQRIHTLHRDERTFQFLKAGLADAGKRLLDRHSGIAQQAA
jgi:alkylation response protein AidB-like acyl-CoA dehydrogenase